MSELKKAAMNDSSEYISNGVAISPDMPTAGDKVKIMYNGLLVKSGTNDIYAYIGFGSTWEDDTYVKMNRNSMGFEATVPILESNTLNVCFKDCSNNWDNNSGENYLFTIIQ